MSEDRTTVVVIGHGPVSDAVIDGLTDHGVAPVFLDSSQVDVWALIPASGSIEIYPAVAGTPQPAVVADAVVLALPAPDADDWPVPPSDLARSVGCEARWDDGSGGWVVTRDDRLATSVPRVWVLGAAAGTTADDTALVDAATVAASVAASLGHSTIVPHTSVDLAALRQRDRAAAADLLPARRAALAELTPQTVVCPCEDITLADAAEVLDQGPRPTSLRDLKLLTRLAMGECQGRGCAAQVVRWAAATGRQDLGHGALRPRVPVVPLRLGSVVPASDVLPDQQQE